jgi:hypothetical protein
LEMELALRLHSGQVMKQTAALNLGILGLNESFVQINEIKDCFSDLFFCIFSLIIIIENRS